MDNWTIAHLTKRLHKARAMVGYWLAKSRPDCARNWQAEADRLTGRLLVIARRFEVFANLKPTSRPAAYCYAKAEAIREQATQ